MGHDTSGGVIHGTEWGLSRFTSMRGITQRGLMLKLRDPVRGCSSPGTDPILGRLVQLQAPF